MEWVGSRSSSSAAQISHLKGVEHIQTQNQSSGQQDIDQLFLLSPSRSFH